MEDCLKNKAQQLDLSRSDDLVKIQDLLESWYPGKARAKSLNKDKLVITTRSSSVANELRFKKEQIKRLLPEDTKIIIG